MATATPSPFGRRSDDMTLDEFLRTRVRQMIAEEIERSREDVRS
jgi:hypothetical protein